MGFDIKAGFVSWVDEDDVVYVAYGYIGNGCQVVFLYKDGGWAPEWIDYIPDAVQDLVTKYRAEENFKKALSFRKYLIDNGCELYVTTEKIVFTDVFPGANLSEKEEYGFYIVYHPTSVDGIYSVERISMCGSEPCETSLIVYRPLTVNGYRMLQKSSDCIAAAGSLC